MKKHGSLFAILTAALTVSVCGCGNVDGISSSASSGSIAEQTSSLMSELTESSSDLSGLTSSSVNSEVGSSTEFPSKCKIYKQTSVQFTDEQLFDWFDRFPECGKPQKSEYYSGENRQYEADGCEGYINDGDCFAFWTNAGNFYSSYYSSVSTRPENDPDRVYMSADGELDFASRDEVLKKIQTELEESFGIMPGEWWALEFSAVKKDGLEAYKQGAYESAYENTDDTDDPDDPGAAVLREKEKEYYENIKDQPARDFYHIEIRYKVDDIPIFYGGFLNIDGTRLGRSVIIETPGFLPNFSGFGNLWQLARIRGKISKDEVRRVIKKVGLDPGEKKHVGKYSLGMRQRLGIAQAIMEDPDILILDEPMNGLDKNGVEDMRELLLRLKDDGKAMIIASHNSVDIDVLCDRVFQIDKGVLTQVR